MKSYEVLSLPGLTKFSEVHALQRELLEKRIRDEIPDTYIFCEHTPVITRGRGLQRFSSKALASKESSSAVRAMPLPIIPPNTDYAQIERGGDLTWHGPGQLVFYPIVKLHNQDVTGHIRFLENVWISTLANLGVTATSNPDGSGVWTKVDGVDRKLASVGVAFRKWVSYHGIAMNIVNDLDSFAFFDPCGFQSNIMSKLQNLPEISPDHFSPDWRNHWEKQLLENIICKLN